MPCSLSRRDPDKITNQVSSTGPFVLAAYREPQLFFNPQVGAAAAAAFAAFLAGIVLQFLVRLATEKMPERSTGAVSALALLPLVLLQLLSSAYTFVLILGRVPSVESAQNQTIGPAVPDAGAAAMFSIAGSLLAVGAVGALSGVVLVIDARQRQLGVLAQWMLRLSVSCVGLFLLIGYLDIRRAFHLPGNHASMQWWAGHVALLLGPTLVGGCWGPTRRQYAALTTSKRRTETVAEGSFGERREPQMYEPGPRSVAAMVAAGFLLTFMPIAVFLAISHTTITVARDYKADWPDLLTLFSAGWAGLSFCRAACRNGSGQRGSSAGFRRQSGGCSHPGPMKHGYVEDPGVAVIVILATGRIPRSPAQGARRVSAQKRVNPPLPRPVIITASITGQNGTEPAASLRALSIGTAIEEARVRLIETRANSAYLSLLTSTGRSLGDTIEATPWRNAASAIDVHRPQDVAATLIPTLKAPATI